MTMKTGIVGKPMVAHMMKRYFCHFCKKELFPNVHLIGEPTFFCSYEHYEAWIDEFAKRDSDVLILTMKGGDKS